MNEVAEPSQSTSRLALSIATCLGIGYIPFASGTFGSAAGLLVWMALPRSATIQLGTIAVLIAVGSWSAGVAERHFGRTDPSQVVVDEVVGMLVTLAFNPVSLFGVVAGFLLFRLTDIVKPYPARRLEKLPGGLGVIADDCMAAIYANLGLRALMALKHSAMG
jgi:phosphatidylglycerophosphatase A